LLDNVLTATSVRSEAAKHIEGSKSQTMRFEFLETIYRLAEIVYAPILQKNIANKVAAQILKSLPGDKIKNPVQKISMAKALKLLFEDYIDKAGFEIANTMEFREKHLYFNKVN
jgi:hypothetical protein